METEQKNTRADQSRINGAKSKGAKTAEGQAKARNGNFKHGAYQVSTTVLPEESMQVFNDLLADARVQFQPRNFFESQLVEEVVELTWQINRLRFLVTAHVNATMILRRERIEVPTRIDEDMLAAEAGGSTPNGPITVLERRIKNYINQRSKILSDLDRLKKTVIPAGPSREPKITKDIVNGWDFQLHKFPPQAPAETSDPAGQPPQPPESVPSGGPTA